MMDVNEVAWGGWNTCLELKNDKVRVIVTLEVGPRILYFSLTGYENVLGVIQDDLGNNGGCDWKFYGGHRLWHSPEDPVRTYVADNDPVTWSEVEDGYVEFRSAIETLTGLEKILRLKLDGESVYLQHEIVNHNLWAVEFAPWALTVLAQHACAEIPHECYVSHEEALLPTRSMIIWPYTKLNDERIEYQDDFISIKQDPNNSSPLKLGFSNQQGWLGAHVSNQWFVKSISYLKGNYPDFGSNCEVFTNDLILELETLGCLENCQPGSSLLLSEQWHLFTDKAQWRSLKAR